MVVLTRGQRLYEVLYVCPSLLLPLCVEQVKLWEFMLPVSQDANWGIGPDSDDKVTATLTLCQPGR